jgi:hypothetical protein
VNPGSEFQWARSFGRYTFGLRRCKRGHVQGYVLREDELGRMDTRGLSLKHVGRWIVAVRRM